DTFPNTFAQVTLLKADNSTEQVTLQGPTTVHVIIGPNGQTTQTNSTGRDQVDTEMVQLSLTGSSSMGAVSLNLDPGHRTLGKITEQQNVTPGILDVRPFNPNPALRADSFFDVFAELHVAGQTLHPATPLHMTSVISYKPPTNGDTYVNPFTQPVQ